MVTEVNELLSFFLVAYCPIIIQLVSLAFLLGYGHFRQQQWTYERTIFSPQRSA